MSTTTKKPLQSTESMPSALLVVNAVIDEAVESAWNDWYNNEHLPEILACPHFAAGARYVTEEDGKRRYLTVYALTSDEALKTPEFASARGWSVYRDQVDATTRLFTKVE